MPLSLDLRNYTKETHSKLEHAMIPLIRNVRSIDEYNSLLKLFYGFYHPVETGLTWASDQLGISKIRKSESLLTDLQIMNSGVNNIPLCKNVPNTSSISQALGVLYVLEGSTLGGQAIAGIIRNNLTTQSNASYLFFQYYGDEVKTTWEQFRAQLDNTENIEVNDALQAANQTFTLFKGWIDGNTERAR